MTHFGMLPMIQWDTESEDKHEQPELATVLNVVRWNVLHQTELVEPDGRITMMSWSFNFFRFVYVAQKCK